MAVKAPAAPVRQRIAIRRDNFVAGGICPEGDYDIKASKITNFAYADKEGKPTGTVTCAHTLDLQPVNAAGQAEGDLVIQNYSVGDIKAYAPSEDGNFIEMVGTRATLASGSNFFIEYEHLLAAGVPENLLEEQGVGILVGARVHIVHIPAPDRSSLQQNNTVGVTGVQAPAKNTQPRTIPVVNKLVGKQPWDKGGSGRTASAPATKTTTQAAAPAAINGATADNGADNRLAGFFKEVVAQYNGEVTMTQGKLQVMKRYNKAGVDQATREAEMDVINDDKQFGDVLASINCELEDGAIKLIQ